MCVFHELPPVSQVASRFTRAWFKTQGRIRGRESFLGSTYGLRIARVASTAKKTTPDPLSPSVKLDLDRLALVVVVAASVAWTETGTQPVSRLVNTSCVPVSVSSLS